MQPFQQFEKYDDPTIVQLPSYLCIQNYTMSLLDEWGGKYMSDYKQF